MPLAEAIARIAAARRAVPQPRPAPFYLRGADAAPAVGPAAGDPAVTPEALAALHAALLSTTPRPWSAAEFASLLAEPGCVPACRGRRGFVLGRALAGEAELLTLAVAPEARRRGSARRLVAGFIAAGTARGRRHGLSGGGRRQRRRARALPRGGLCRGGPRRGYYRTPEGGAVDALVLRHAADARSA